VPGEAECVDPDVTLPYASTVTTEYVLEETNVGSVTTVILLTVSSVIENNEEKLSVLR
jgi:hypothetical protein